MIKDIYLLVGGEATRLRPLSEGIPKALLTIKGRLLIDLILENLEESNLDNINLICSIKHESYWVDYKKNSKYNVNLHFEHEKLDTGGYVIQNIENFDDKFFCMNGDLLIDMNFESFMEMANNSKNSTICSIPVEDPDVSVNATCVRVATEIGHAESIYFELEKKLDINEIKNILKVNKEIIFSDTDYFTPIDSSGNDWVYISRLRKDLHKENCFNFWVVSDNLLKGAALNSVQIAELLIKNGKV